MAEQSEGGCLCGNVRYQAKPDPETAYYCHCRDCQLGSGSAFHVAVLAPEDSFVKLSGQTSQYTKTADSGNGITRVFCQQCGAPLWWVGDGFPGLVVLTVSSLDEPDQVTPSRELWTDSAVSWCRIPEHVEQFARRPIPKPGT